MIRRIPIDAVGKHLRGLAKPCATCGGVRWSYSNRQPVDETTAYVICRACENTRSSVRFKASQTSNRLAPGVKLQGQLDVNELLRW